MLKMMKRRGKAILQHASTCKPRFVFFLILTDVWETADCCLASPATDSCCWGSIGLVASCRSSCSCRWQKLSILFNLSSSPKPLFPPCSGSLPGWPVPFLSSWLGCATWLTDPSGLRVSIWKFKEITIRKAIVTTKNYNIVIFRWAHSLTAQSMP